MRTCYYLNDWTEEIMPCKADIQSWAEWLSKPDEEWKRPKASEHGETFTASATDVHEITAEKIDGIWKFFPAIPQGTGYMVVIDGPDCGWHADEMVDDLEHLINFLDGEDENTALVACLVDHNTDYIFTYNCIDAKPSGSIEKRVLQ